VILWEDLSPEDQERYCVDLQEDENWVVWCKVKPKDMATQKFRTCGKCIFDGKRIKPKKDDNPEDFTGGKHVTRARSCYKGVMGAGSVCLQKPGRNLEVRVGREEEGTSSLRPELAAIARTLQAIPLETDLLYLCDSEASLNRMSRWIGSGPKTTLAGDPNADIVTSIVERMRARVLKGARTFMVKVMAHRGEPLNENADTQAESARQLPSEHRQWTTRTQTMTYEWRDNDGVKHVTAWSKAVRNAMLRGGAEYQRQKALNRAAHNWNQAFMLSTNSGLQRIKQASSSVMYNYDVGKESAQKIMKQTGDLKAATLYFAS
jgi:ribonuclease HI